MRIPTHTQTAAYFKSLDIKLERCSGSLATRPTWQLTWPSGDEEAYESLLELWSRWTLYAHALIADEEAFCAFKAAYEDGPEAVRAELREWIDAYFSYPLGPKCNHKVFSEILGAACNGLPADWKTRVAELISRNEPLAFANRAKVFLDKQSLI